MKNNVSAINSTDGGNMSFNIYTRKGRRTITVIIVVVLILAMIIPVVGSYLI